MCQQGDTNKQQREKRISWTQVQPKNLKTRTWAARVVTYLLYHKCNAEPVNVYTSLLTTYGAVLWQIANIYLYCTVNLQDSAPNNNYYERRKNQTSESTEKNSELQMRFRLWHPLEFTIERFTTELLEGVGSKFNYYTPAREDYVYQILVQNQLYITFDYQ